MRKLTATGKRMLTAVGKWATSCLSGWPPTDPCPIDTPPCVETTFPCNSICPTGKTPGTFRFTVSGVNFNCLPANHNMSCGDCGPEVVEECTPVFRITDTSFGGVFDLDATSACNYEYRETNAEISVEYLPCADGSLGTHDVTGDFDLVIRWNLAGSTNNFSVDLYAKVGGSLGCCGPTFRVNIAVMTIHVGDCLGVTNCGYVDNAGALGANPTLCFSVGGGGYHHGQGGTVSGESCP